MNTRANAPGPALLRPAGPAAMSVSPAAIAVDSGDPERFVALLTEIVAELRLIRFELRRQTGAAPLADRLIAAVHGLLGNETFSATTLLTLADSPLSTRLQLRAAVEDIIRDEASAPGGGRRLGKFLRSNMQHEAEGLRLVSLAKGRDGYCYRIELATETRTRWNL